MDEIAPKPRSSHGRFCRDATVRLVSLRADEVEAIRPLLRHGEPLQDFVRASIAAEIRRRETTRQLDPRALIG
jgi:hypothetical protein